MSHLFLAITAHGYGHLAQSAPVVSALVRRMPGLRVTLQGNIDSWFAERRLPAGFRHIRESADVGLLMDGPLRTKWEESLVEYVRFDADYDLRLRHQTRVFERDPPDLVLSNVPWLPLDAAKVMGIPAVAICSLNWHDILLESPVGDQVPPSVAERLRSVYAAADLFLRPAPSMPMGWLPNGRDVGPIALRRPNLGGRLRGRVGIPEDRPLVLMQFGGFEGFDPLESWPEQDRVHWVVPEHFGAPRKDTLVLADLGLSVIDVLGSCDAVLTKPGYGTFAEAACNGKPVLYVSRGDWPEEPALTGWLRRQIPAEEIPLDELIAGRVIAPLEDLLASGPVEPVPPTGVDEVAGLLEPLLRGA